jgi:hypothetical protein
MAGPETRVTGELEIIEDCRLALRPVHHFLLRLPHFPSTNHSRRDVLLAGRANPITLSVWKTTIGCWIPGPDPRRHGLHPRLRPVLREILQSVCELSTIVESEPVLSALPAVPWTCCRIGSNRSLQACPDPRSRWRTSSAATARSTGKSMARRCRRASDVSCAPSRFCCGQYLQNLNVSQVEA